MKKMIAILLLVVSFTVCVLFGTVSSYVAFADEPTPKKERLVIYNCADYIDIGDEDREGLIEKFEKYYQDVTGVELEIEYNTFETNEEMVTKALKSDAEIDLFSVSEYTIEKLLRSNALREINFDNVPNNANINPEVMDVITNVFGNLQEGDKTYDMTKYMVPYMWGTLGILYNTEYVTDEDLECGWGLLWNKADNPLLNGKILMKDSVRDSLVAAVLYAKETDRFEEPYASMSIQELINTVNDDVLNVVKEVLVEQRDCYVGYEVDFGKDDLIKGNAFVDLAWSGDAMYAIEEAEQEGVELDYFVPEIGGNVWFDGWVIPNQSKNVRAAEMFIDYMCDPVSAMYNMMFIGYTSAVDKYVLMENEEALAILEENEYDIEEFFEDEDRYPEMTENLGIMRDYGDKAEAAIILWEEIKPSNTNALLIILAVLIGVIGIAILAYFLYSKYHGTRVYNR